MKKLFLFLATSSLFVLLFFNNFLSSLTLVKAQNQTATFQAQEYVPASTFISPEKRAPFVFTALGASWRQEIPEGTSAQIYARFKENTRWTEWYLLEPDIDGNEKTSDGAMLSFLSVNPTDTFQYKVVLQKNNSNKTPLIDDIEFTFINSGANQKTSRQEQGFIGTPSGFKQSSLSQTALSQQDGIKIISRAEWGADESLRLFKEENPPYVPSVSETDFEEKYADELKLVKTITHDEYGNRLTWPLEYPDKISKIIIHHTATTKNLDDPKKAIRDIYYWHTITRRWGDIGYNYIIDQQGNIYEGRFGGDKVVGAHAGKANTGSIGIAVLGNYQDAEVPEPVLKALASLVHLKAKQHNIDILGSSTFRGENTPNLLGHQNVDATSCPGKNLYVLLPTIQKLASQGLQASIVDRRSNPSIDPQYDFQFADDLSIFELEPGTQQNLTIRLKNTGSAVWKKGTTLFLYHTNNAYQYFMMDKRNHSEPLASDIQPGQTAEFQFTVTPGYKTGYTMIELYLLMDGIKKIEKYLQLPVHIKVPVYDYELVEVKVLQPVLRKNKLTEAVVALKNTGNVTWKKSGDRHIVLGSEKPRDHINTLLRNPGTRLGYLEEIEVPPGQIGHFKVFLKAPEKAGRYREYFSPLIEGLHWLEYKQNYIELYVYDTEYKAEVSGLGLRQDFLPGEKRTVTFQLKNIGGATWNQKFRNTLMLDIKPHAEIPVENISFEGTDIKPGETATVHFDVQAPTKEGLYALMFTPKIGNYKAVNNDVRLIIRVTTGGSVGSPTGSTSSAPRSVIPETSPQNTPVQSQPSTVTQSSFPLIRIDLAFEGNPVISASGDFIVQKDGQQFASFSKDEKVSVSYENGVYKIVSGSQVYDFMSPPKFSSPSGAILRIENFDRRPAWNQNINYNEFRGALEARFYNGRMHTINELPIEDYLKGTGEINEKEPREKLRTIITVARTYAYFYTTAAEKFPGAPFHLTDDPERSQKYVGYSAEKNAPNTVQAVKDTEGLVVTYNGKVIKTPYFSSDDGRTRSAEEVWGWKDTPYLISVPDPYCQGKQMAGHGVGLSGCGSLGMANNGKTFKEIIQYYYQGVDLTKLW